jgi:hypothetical protein
MKTPNNKIVSQKRKSIGQPKTYQSVSNNLLSTRKFSPRDGLLSFFRDPFNSQAVTPLPDGNSSRRITMLHSGYTDFSLTAGSATIRIMALLPYGSMTQLASGTAFTISDPLCGTCSSTYSTTNSPNIWTPCTSFNAYSSILNDVDACSKSTTGPFGQTKARCIGLAWRIIYTGTVQAAAGLVTCKDVPVSKETELTMPASTVNVWDPDALALLSPTFATPCFTFDMPAYTAGLDQGMVRQVRLDSNPWGIVRQNNYLYQWKPYWEQPKIALSSTYTAAQIANAATTKLNSSIANDWSKNNWQLINCYDDSLSTTEIRITGVQNPTNFRLQVNAIWEYMVQPISPMYSLTLEPPKRDESVLNRINLRLSQLPPVMAFSESG